MGKLYETNTLGEFITDLRAMGVTEYEGPCFFRTDLGHEPCHKVKLKLGPIPATPEQEAASAEAPKDTVAPPKRDPVADLEARLFPKWGPEPKVNGA